MAAISCQTEGTGEFYVSGDPALGEEIKIFDFLAYKDVSYFIGGATQAVQPEEDRNITPVNKFDCNRGDDPEKNRCSDIRDGNNYDY